MRNRRRGQKGARVWVQRPLVQRGGRRALDDHPEVHHRHVVRDVADNAEVVTDEEIGKDRSSRSRSRSCRIWAWTETSRALTGSSRTTSSGLTARARAMPTRCRCPPESSFGYRPA